MDVLPIPPAPIRATEVRLSAKVTTSSISSSRPKQALGAGGGSSPVGLGGSAGNCIHPDDLDR